MVFLAKEIPRNLWSVGKSLWQRLRFSSDHVRPWQAFVVWTAILAFNEWELKNLGVDRARGLRVGVATSIVGASLALGIAFGVSRLVGHRLPTRGDLDERTRLRRLRTLVFVSYMLGLLVFWFVGATFHIGDAGILPGETAFLVAWFVVAPPSGRGLRALDPRPDVSLLQPR